MFRNVYELWLINVLPFGAYRIFPYFYINNFVCKGCVQVFEKDLNMGYLLDFYGELLSERKRSTMDMYYNEDFSLAEIAEQMGISRQGVRDIIKKSEEELIFYEEKLGLAKKMSKAEEQVDELCKLANSLELPEEIHKKIIELSMLIRQ